MKRRRPSRDVAATPGVTVLRGQEHSGPLYTCTACGQPKPPAAYARWGLSGGRIRSMCAAQGACDACFDEITRFPADMPLPVMVVEVSRRSDAPAVRRLTA